VPQGPGGFNQRAVIGTDDQDSGGALAGVATLSTLLPAAKQTIHGLALGLRELDFTVTPPAFINPAPAAGALTGSLTISGATTVLNNVSGPAASIGADGRILVGVDGRGYLTMLGGTLSGAGLIVAGENVTTGNGTSLVDLRGSSTLTINGTSQLNRRLRVEGPGVNFTTTGQLRLDSSNTYTAVITSATDHSPLRTNNNAIVNGNLFVEFSGAAATRDPIATLGESWPLVVSTLSNNAIAGNFTNLGPGGDVQVSGLAPGSQPPLGAAYRLRIAGTAGPPAQTTLELVYDRVLVLTVNRDTGQVSIRNPLAGNIAIDGYTISSPLGSLLTSYTGLGSSTPGAGTWVKPTNSSGQPLNTSNALTEIQQPDFTPPITVTPYNLTSVPSVSLGTGFSKTAVAGNIANFGIDGEDLLFEYTSPGKGVIRGHVEYVGTKFENNLVLRVNPNTGQAFLKNDSLETLVVDGYSILSSTGNLSGAGFTGLGGGWQSSTATPNALTQTNLTGSTTLAPNQQVAIGDISATGFATAATQAGLSLQFALAQGLVSVEGDYNGNGTVDAADYVVWRKTDGSPPGYATWRANFGRTGGGPEPTFRIGSVVFDTTAGAGSGAALTAVPEPPTGLALVIGVGCLLVMRAAGACRSRQFIYAPIISRNFGRKGGRAMPLRSRLALTSLIGVLVTTVCELPAGAVTQGIPLTNSAFSLPGPIGTKVVAFGESGIPFAPTDPVVALSSGQLAGGTPGWTFTGGAGGAGEEACTGLGCSTFGDGLPGDSGTEGGGNPGNELLLSTLDGRVYQTSSFNVVSIPATQKYLLNFDAHNVFTPTGNAHLQARLFYVDTGGNRQTIGTPLVASNLAGFQTYSLELVGGSAFCRLRE
jgi:hypothetical protein